MEKVAFITGAGGYIGGETAMVLAKSGMKIAVCDINEAGVQKTVDRLRAAGYICKGYVIDITDSRQVDEGINKAAEELGGLDVLVHVAGGSARIAGGDYLPLVEQEDYVIDKVLKVNLYGAFWTNRAAARIMIKQGRGGKIINFSSAVYLNGLASCSDYAAAKGGVTSLTKALSKELGKYKINVNAVAPGIVMRPGEEDYHRTYETNLLGEKCLGEDVANLVEFLASDKARFITGQTYLCDGGRTLSMKGSD